MGVGSFDAGSFATQTPVSGAAVNNTYNDYLAIYDGYWLPTGWVGPHFWTSSPYGTSPTTLTLTTGYKGSGSGALEFNVALEYLGAIPIPTVSFAATTGSANEGDSASQPVNVTADLSSATTAAVTVPITYGGTATSGSDYSAATTSITIAAGATSGTASFSVVGDSTVESNETVVLTMGTPTGATLGANTSYTHTITNDEFAGAGNDVMTGTMQDDSMSGLAGNDTILGFEGNDYLDGGSGNDYIQGGLGNDTLFGGEGLQDTVSYLLANGGVSGNGGSAAGGVTGGAGGNIGALTNGVYQALGTWVSVAGQTGASNTTLGGAGQSVTIVDTGLPITGGASGGGKTAGNANNIGGNVTGFGSVIPTITGGAALSAGDRGIYSQTPFYSLGGAGGGANFNGTGGRGGDGLVIITCW
jgi:hypothetical protein